MKKLLFSFIAFILVCSVFSQKTATSGSSQRPKLVVGIVVDQMRWDYLYRYNDRYQNNGGFKRLLSQGFSCENTLIPYAPTITACGHTCIYTGSVPNIHGIVGNNWYDNINKKSWYCTDDPSVETVGSTTNAGKMSPRNMLTSTMCDELKLATNFKSKVIGVAIKDRGSILPAGHSANGAYWYDSKSGQWVTSTFYRTELPKWVNDFNSKKLPDQYYEKGWNTLYPINTYTQSTADAKDYEAKPFGDEQKGFPYALKQFVQKDYGKIASTPFGNSMTFEMAKAAVTNEQMGTSGTTDFLAISFSSPDYIGHAFGPNSIEAEDNYLRFDIELGEFLNFLDAKVGKGQYLLFLSADHGVAHVPGFMQENKFPAGTLDKDWRKNLKDLVKQKFGQDNIITATDNHQVYLDHELIEKEKLDEAAIKTTIINYLQKLDGISQVVDLAKLGETPINDKIKMMLGNGYFPRRSGDIQMILEPEWLDANKTGTTHSLWNPYDAHIPLLWYGWNIKPGKSNREVYMTDIAATVAALLHMQMPSGCVGHVIEEVAK